jgi:urease accessory protein UreF
MDGLSRRLVGDHAAMGHSSGQVGGAANAAEVEAWLARYRDETIVRAEWPVVAEAWRLASTGLSDGLVELDRAWGGHARPGEASLRVGQRQLSRLRPLRDVRVVQRYLDAVEGGRARGWHPVVFGVWLAVFGVPLRQGLVQYAEQTLGGLLDSVPRPAVPTETAREKIRAGIVEALPSLLAAFLPASHQPLKALR